MAGLGLRRRLAGRRAVGRAVAAFAGTTARGDEHNRRDKHEPP
jgi:hypothetical protein